MVKLIIMIILLNLITVINNYCCHLRKLHYTGKEEVVCAIQ